MSKFAAKITSKGQVPIPEALRENLDLQQGDCPVLEAKGDRVEAWKAPVAPFEDFDTLADRVAERFTEKGITRSDVEEAIRWARSAS